MAPHRRILKADLRFSLTLLSLAALCPTLSGQAVKGATNIAPPASARFPAEWYPPDNDVTYTEAPVTGLPYTGTMVTAGPIPDPRSGQSKTMKMETFQARDSAGRMRSEVIRPRPDPAKNGEPVNQRIISISDPVSHCSFEWAEPWIGPEEPSASASCMPRTLHYSSNSRDPSSEKDGEDHSFPSQTRRTEHIGERTFEGLKTIGVRITLTNPTTGSAGQIVSEAWYSPELKENILFSVQTGARLITYELTNVHRTEPDPALFYPPANYKILNATDRSH